MTPVNLVSDAFRWQTDSSGTWLCVKTTRPIAVKTCSDVEQGTSYDITIKKHREKRSLDMNAYCWVLIGKLAAKLALTPEEVYRQYIPDVADNYTIVPIKEEHIEHWDRIWCKGHIGRMTKDMGPCRNISGYHNIMSFFGSSDYDTAQMHRLIELVVSDCKSQGIETLPPEELERLEREWDAKA